MERTAITIQIGAAAELGRGRAAPLTPQQVQATVIGRWAAHQTWNVGGEDYSVTHVPSGLVAGDRMTEAAAIEAARLLSMVLDVEVIDRDRHIDIVRRELARVGGRFVRRGARRAA